MRACKTQPRDSPGFSDSPGYWRLPLTGCFNFGFVILEVRRTCGVLTRLAGGLHAGGYRGVVAFVEFFGRLNKPFAVIGIFHDLIKVSG